MVQNIMDMGYDRDQVNSISYRQSNSSHKVSPLNKYISVICRRLNNVSILVTSTNLTFMRLLS